jgi:membrane fusion protein (multidrug efflux system)
MAKKKLAEKKSAEKKRPTRLYMFCIGAVVVAALGVSYLYLARSGEIAAVREARAMHAAKGPRIEVVAAAAGPKERTIKLLGDLRSGATTTLYGKVAGYLKTISADKGDKVEAGQVLAYIESPELDQQYAGASADLANKRRTRDRARELYAKGIATQVALNQAETDATVSENTVAVLETQRSYQTVRAPFGGRVTARFVDPGALITNAQTNVTSALPILTISDDTRVRIYAYVQQADAPFVHVGDAVDVSDASNQDRKKIGAITRMTGELDQKTRTMLIQVDLDNGDGFFIPGSFAYLTLHVPLVSQPQIPVTALLMRSDQSSIAMVDGEVVKFRPVKVASTDGATITIADGVKAGDKIAINVPDEVTDGSRIQPVGAVR